MRFSNFDTENTRIVVKLRISRLVRQLHDVVKGRTCVITYA